jgi:hypothetical protein
VLGYNILHKNKKGETTYEKEIINWGNCRHYGCGMYGCLQQQFKQDRKLVAD